MDRMRWARRRSGLVDRMGMLCRAAALAVAAVALPATAQEAATALKADEIRAEPFADARVVGALKKGDAVTLLRRQGGWAEVKAGSASGWVRVLSVRKGGAAPTPGADVSAVAGLATGRAGTGQIVSTTGVRGLGEEDLKSARFDAAQLQRAEAAAMAADPARRFAAEAGLASRTLLWLPAPAPATLPSQLTP
jgi:Bacterial SH3 domain